MTGESDLRDLSKGKASKQAWMLALLGRAPKAGRSRPKAVHKKPSNKADDGGGGGSA